MRNEIVILINALGIQDSGGITVFDKVLSECANSDLNNYYIVCNENKGINRLFKKYKNTINFEFKIIENKGFLYRLYYENILFRNIIRNKNIKLIYNFSGSAQFMLKIPQLVKLQNLLFYSKKLDEVYKQKNKTLIWLKQIFFKRFIFKMMLNQAKYLEIQSSHVKDYLSDYVNIEYKIFYVKSDIEVSDNLFSRSKEYDFSKKIKFLYIVGPHFEYIHKNFFDFVSAMLSLKNENVDFEINITLTKEQLHNSGLWNNELDSKTNFLGYVNTKNEMNNLFTDNTILISNSIIETLGLHVVEAVENGILAISPNELYAKSVYGSDILTYELFDVESLVNRIYQITLLSNNNIKDIILKNQQYLIDNEKTKYKNVLDIFDEILKEEYVQK